jgi:hypothetical protein
MRKEAGSESGGDSVRTKLPRRSARMERATVAGWRRGWYTCALRISSSSRSSRLPLPPTRPPPRPARPSWEAIPANRSGYACGERWRFVARGERWREAEREESGRRSRARPVNCPPAFIYAGLGLASTGRKIVYGLSHVYGSDGCRF